MKLCKVSLAVSALLLAQGAHAQQASEEDELAMVYGDRTISIATGNKQSISRAPAVASVITTADIEAMGAQDLDQVLEAVPGLHVSMLGYGSIPIYSFRGIHTGFNPQVLMLVNGLPITHVFLGNRSLAWGGFPLENVARIEIIRGPGSALYGADAYAGVINIVTKTAADINGTQLSARAGSFNTRDGSVQYGGMAGPVSLALYARRGDTDGQKGIIEKDFQGILDPLFGTHASLAPGHISASRAALDVRADAAFENWRLRLAHQERKVGMMAGLADSLDPYSRMPEKRDYADLSYHDARFAPGWDVSAILGYYDSRENPGAPAYLLFPPGAFGGAFPTGAIGNPGHSERHSNVSLSAFYAGFAAHRLRFGMGYRREDLYAAPELKNFTFIAVPGIGPVFTPLPGLVDATGNPALVYLTPHDRSLNYGFVQDEWALSEDWSLTAGLRHDRYSDFGSTTNPRLALVWNASYNTVIKAMHGRAYRAPSFTEQFNVNNPVTIGNPNLRPETINTDELAASWDAAPGVQATLTLFHYHMEDIIRFVANADPTTGATAQNAGNQTGHGLESEVSWDVSRQLRLNANLSLQHATDSATGKGAGLAPRSHAFVRADWRFAPQWQIGGTLNHVAGRERQPGDNRPAIANYTLVDLNLRSQSQDRHWDWLLTVQNVFNRDAREPSFAPGNIPFDLPLPGRAVSVQLTARF